MSAVTFEGGLHPPGGKGPTEKLAVEKMAVPSEVVIPLSQHIGAPAKAAVEAGAEVKMGQMVGEPSGFISAAIHASVSGKVKAVEPRVGMMGVDIMSVVIENDGQDTPADIKGLGDGWKEAGPDELKVKVASAGIVGMGGATFPTVVKLSPPAAKPIDTVILNGAECEPMLTADHRLMLESTEEVIRGLNIVLKILGAKRGIIGVEENKPDAIEAVRKAAGSDIEVMVLKVKYPQGAEKQLISACLGRIVPSLGLPMDVGVVVHNVGTAKAISDAVVHGRPLIERIVTVSGSAAKRPANLLVRVGTPISEVIELTGGVQGSLGKLIVGGPMMGIAQRTDEAPVTKATSGILLFSQDEVSTEDPLPCIRCGRCIRSCPMRISPTDIATFSRKQMLEEAEAADALDCMECGTCAYGCPSAIPLVQEIRLGKALINASKRKK
jgi:electron transport complex protein RnfC